MKLIDALPLGGSAFKVKAWKRPCLLVCWSAAALLTFAWRNCRESTQEPVVSLASRARLSAKAALLPTWREPRHRLADGVAVDTEHKEYLDPGTEVARRRSVLSVLVAAALSGASAKAVEDRSGMLPRLADGRVRACVSGEKCVSTASFKSPSNYMPAWIAPTKLSIEQAAARLRRAVEDLGAQAEPPVAVPNGGLYVAATAQGWGEKMDFVLRHDDYLEAIVVTFRIVGGGPGGKLPDPPGCFKRGCINGPPQRRYATALGEELGWLPLEPDEEKRWVPLLLH
eukprot:gnl/TRDRNA2_/TRDRNA2_132926_c0_seq1.p1 gnl/TRDRNA2_/TRDRNA2_132926_c0~~gnl/TRDRNA2_/TRDRNA2_132926_c0_seq1.p1  ORF type:complete len:292 (+),score=49.39 gnl/TRDRNA2_/TRDRNA2_132926_c0_seq1:25-876(+)